MGLIIARGLSRIWRLGGLVALLVSLSACWPMSYTEYRPVYQDMAVFRVAGSIQALAWTEAPKGEIFGKIGLSADREFLFVNERNHGIRVAYIGNPANPAWIGFIEIPGNTDLVALELDGRQFLYVDSFIDLVVLELTLPPDGVGQLAAVERHRIERAFPQNQFQIDQPEQVWPYWTATDGDGPDQIVVGYTSQEKFSMVPLGIMVDPVMDIGNQAGAVGSMARFALYSPPLSAGADWYLYTVDSSTLRGFTIEALDATDLGQPVVAFQTSIGWQIETIFPYADQLFIGSESAMYIYGLSGGAASPTSPGQLSTLVHFTARDPVVVGPVGAGALDTAFVTLRAEAGWGENLLLAIDVSDPALPVELTRRLMYNPHGLSLYDVDTLFVCEGTGGIKEITVSQVRDVEADLEVRLGSRSLVDDFETYDIIPGPVVQIAVGPSEVRLYSYDADTPQLVELGRLAF
ncbi:MAG: hypothetical protein A2087_14525 [Spirochaetes bacterium GWD1_61_31]|nr:MAG: hypothetical protein A2Y37_11015 [Spirochaetes bacterium GWB1_60_80]OHD33700.1 MAG: hypothetical protein A2004_09675 [Spirochaetes bacterium GWC1_61_12]OHD37302.1 MAG: hypothetical protein A2087_14525 [Spirochaetes bacterium GWD1_61_31]OHD44967.1 MAG: hypothetical protein A2Y35_13060 [Spirochaetes bacterium GWE1_60_18]OHD60076.1 MAG: hypothetical protein A2Y32_11170 [Spirochaetes bacterium GWF1_60_12]HAP43641.1 hypothetical protein [Spirochaetaceae bacterium]